MQIDNMPKDKSIKQLLSRLVSKYGSNSFKLTDYWDGDLCAIGLLDIDNKHLIYISTFAKAENLYFISLEDRNSTDGDNHVYTSKVDYDNVTLDELENHFTKHLKIETTSHNKT